MRLSDSLLVLLSTLSFNQAAPVSEWSASEFKYTPPVAVTHSNQVLEHAVLKPNVPIVNPEEKVLHNAKESTAPTVNVRPVEKPEEEIWHDAQESFHPQTENEEVWHDAPETFQVSPTGLTHEKSNPEIQHQKQETEHVAISEEPKPKPHIESPKTESKPEANESTKSSGWYDYFKKYFESFYKKPTESVNSDTQTKDSWLSRYFGSFLRK